MSATNRGTKRVASDFYPTPLKSFNPLLPYLPKDKFIWEPACGDERLIKRMKEYGLKADGNDLTYGYDFLKDDSRRECIVTNPPFSIARSFVTHALKNCNEVYMLLRLNFLGSDERKEWWKKHTPSCLFILSKRPSFVKSLKCAGTFKGKILCLYKELISSEKESPKKCPGCGGKIKVTNSDSCEYAWFYWGSEHKGFIHL